MPNASPGYITALKASLANVAHGWQVLGSGEQSSTRLSAVTVTGSVTGSTTGETTGETYGEIVGGNGVITGSVTGSVEGSVTGSTSSTNASETIDLLIVQLAATAMRTPGEAGPMRLTYVSKKVNGSFSSALIRQGGAELTSSDSALDTTIRGMATAFQSARDTALTAALGVAPVATPSPKRSASSGLIEALKDSLGDPDASWLVSGGTTVEVKEPRQGPNESIEMVVVRIERTVGVTSPLVRVAINAYGPLSFAYIGISDADDNYIESHLYLNGKLFVADDEALHDLVLSMASDDADDADAQILASLEHGPQTNDDIAAALAEIEDAA